jgi:dTMP kinase
MLCDFARAQKFHLIMNSTLHTAIQDLPEGGIFLTFEGIDGAGKSSHIDALKQSFLDAGREVVCSREPGGTPLAEKIRNMVLNDPMDPLSEALLVFAGRRDHLNNVILPAIERGAVVLCDRFTDSTFAYQGGGRGFDKQILHTMESWVQQERQPDITLWFDLPAAVAEERRGAVRSPDRFEALDTTFFDNVRQAYADRMEQDPQRFVRLNALQSKEAVWDELCTKLSDRMGDLAEAWGKKNLRRVAP